MKDEDLCAYLCFLQDFLPLLQLITSLEFPVFPQIVMIVCLAFQQENQVIGAPLERLLGANKKIPPVLERLISAIENNGLYTVGLYRKPGHAAKIRQLIKDINTGRNIMRNLERTRLAD